MIGVGEKKAAFLRPPRNEVADRRDVVFSPECVDQIVFIHVGHIRKLIKREIFLEMVIDVPPYQAALLADFALRRIRGKGKAVPAQQTQQNYVQQMLSLIHI